MLKAGVSITDISPDKGVELAGYPHCPRPNKGVHDPLYASCLYLNDGSNEVIIVTLDLLFFGKKYVNQLRAKFHKNIMFTCTHTHSGPWASQVLAAEKADNIDCNEDYIKKLMTLLEDGISKAMQDPFEAKLGIQAGHCGAEQGVGGNRRVKNGICDPSVNVLAIKDSEDTVKACLVNYALHPTYLHAENELVTADYPAYLRRYLSFAYPDAITLFAQGTSGNQSSRYHRVDQSFEEAARVGTTIGVEVFHCIENMKFLSDIKLKVKSKDIDLPIREFPSYEVALENVKKAREKFESLKSGDYIPMRNAELALFGAENILSYSKMAQDGFKSEELPCEIQMISINDSLIVGIQGEIFVEYGLEMKNASPYKNTFIFEVTNGALPGYVYTPEAYKEGGYEVGTSMLTEYAGEKITNTVKEMF